MAFNTAITGIKAATIELDVTGNNIANASTVGYKSARTEFSDIFTTVVVGAGSTNNPGAGVIVSDIAQDFTAGTIEFTNNNLDLAIDGSGFFQLNDGQGGITYTRAGGFELDKDGNVVTKSGKFLQGYGLDDSGNQLPIGTLAVSEKENPPKATDDIDLSFNIDSRSDPSNLTRPYDPDDSGTFTFSTTTRIFDSLGNENTIKFDMIEQPPLREQQTITFVDATSATGGSLQFAGVTIDLTAAGSTLIDTNPASASEVAAAVAAQEAAIRTRDPRVASVEVNPADENSVLVTYLASATDVEDVVIADGGAYTNGTTQTTPATLASNPDLSAVEQQAIRILAPTGAGTISIGGVPVPVSSTTTPPDTATDVVNRIVANQTAIITANPEIESIQADTVNSRVLINYKSDEGNVNPLVVSESIPGGTALAIGEIQSFDVTAAATGTTAVNVTVPLASGSAVVNVTTLSVGDTPQVVADKIAAAINAASPASVSNVTAIGTKVSIEYTGASGSLADVSLAGGAGVTFGTVATEKSHTQAETLIEGDSSHEGVYRMFAYLNGSELLDIGKQVAPGAPGSAGTPVVTEAGPILLTFDNTNGVLSTVNGLSVAGSGSAPTLTVVGADPADPANNITLDITGTTQFASESIVKAATQDGFAKGDLIGVAFAEDGTMVASFSNGQNTNLGIVALATFENQSGLQSVGDTEWGATLDSGQAILNPPGTGLNGLLRSAALEQSNVDLSEELVALIEAQRNFQANSKTLQTENAVTQTILQIS